MSDTAVKVTVADEKPTGTAGDEKTAAPTQETPHVEAPPLAQNDWRPFGLLRREVERVFDEFYRGPWRLPFSRTAFDFGPVWPGEAVWGSAPAADIVERANAFVISTEMPGVAVGNIEVSLSRDRLTIKAKKEQKTEEDRKGVYLSERRYGSLQRSFRVPEGVDRDRIEASFADGVLTVTLPKTAQAINNERSIEVKGA